jgi:hypothetical protein
MSEETGTPETTVETTTPETTPAATPQSFIDGQGNFTEGWENAYLTEDQRANARVSGGRVTSVQNLLDTVINSDKMISGDKILKPSDSFGDEDWDIFHKAGGWTGETIPMSAPEGIPDGMWSEDRATGFSEVFNKLRLTPQQQAGIVEAYNADIMQQVTDMSNNSETSSAAVKAELLAEKGNAYTQFMHNGDFAVEKGMDDAEHKQRLIDKFGKDVDFIRLMGNLGSGFAESGSIPTAAMSDTPADIQGQLDTLRNSPAFTSAMHPEHKATMTKIRQLHIKKASIKQPA